MARNCLSLAKKFSIRCRALSRSVSKARGVVRDFRGGITAVLPASARGSSTRWSASKAALVGFRGGGAGSRNQACDKGAEQGSPTPARVVDELEEAEIKRQLVLRETPVRAQPGAQQGPEPGSCRLSGWWGPD